MSYSRLSCSCIICKTIITSNNIHQHYRSKRCRSGQKATNPQEISVPEDCKCIHCGKQCKNENSYRQHVIRCSKNIDRIVIQTPIHVRRKGIPAWNKGLTKKTDERIKAQAESLSSYMKNKISNGEHSGAWTAEYWTEDRRREKSKEKKDLYKKFPEKHPNRKLANNRIKMTYPEKVAHDWLVSQNISFIHQAKILSYFVDFKVGTLLIEIDGERWHPIGNEKDQQRDLELLKHGYTVVRIRSKEKIEERLKETFSDKC